MDPNKALQKGLPSIAEVQSDALTLPQTGGGGLVGFKDVISQVVNLAKQERNKMGLSLMAPLQGTVAASDFSSILGNLNKASDTTTQELLKETKPAYKVEQIGDTLYQFQVDPTGKLVGKPTVVVSNPSSSKTDVKKEQADDVASAILDFQRQIQTKGWAGANPAAYEYYKDALIKQYGASAALELDKAMLDAGIIVDRTNK